MIAELLKEGKQNKTTFEELQTMTNMHERELRKQISEERKKGAIILATKEGAGGYYLPQDAKEAQQYIDTMTKEAKSILYTLKYCKKYVKKNPNQQILEI